MNKGELIDKIAKDARISKVQAGSALNSAIEGVTGALKRGGKVTLVGFGTFSVSLQVCCWLVIEESRQPRALEQPVLSDEKGARRPL